MDATPAAPGDTNCAGKLGVSRVIEIDTTGGPKFGLQQYKDHDILRDHEVVLTFDDGPLRRTTPLVLAELAAHCTRATFFMVGKMAQADPEMVREVARHGHTIGTHTWSHANLKRIGTARAQKEVDLGIAAVSTALGRPNAPFFRFPYLADSRSVIADLASRNIAMFSIDADALDYRAHDAARVHRNVMHDLLPVGKGIILFHDIQKSTAQGGLKVVLDDLQAKGFKIVQLVPKAQPATDTADKPVDAGLRPTADTPRSAPATPVARASHTTVHLRGATDDDGRRRTLRKSNDWRD